MDSEITNPERSWEHRLEVELGVELARRFAIRKSQDQASTSVDSEIGNTIRRVARGIKQERSHQNDGANKRNSMHGSEHLRLTELTCMLAAYRAISNTPHNLAPVEAASILCSAVAMIYLAIFIVIGLYFFEHVLSGFPVIYATQEILDHVALHFFGGLRV